MSDTQPPRRLIGLGHESRRAISTARCTGHHARPRARGADDGGCARHPGRVPDVRCLPLDPARAPDRRFGARIRARRQPGGAGPGRRPHRQRHPGSRAVRRRLPEGRDRRPSERGPPRPRRLDVDGVRIRGSSTLRAGRHLPYGAAGTRRGTLRGDMAGASRHGRPDGKHRGDGDRRRDGARRRIEHGVSRGDRDARHGGELRPVPVRVPGPDAGARSEAPRARQRRAVVHGWIRASPGRSARRTSRTSSPAPPRSTGPSEPSSDCSRSCTPPCGSSSWARSFHASRRARRASER